MLNEAPGGSRLKKTGLKFWALAGRLALMSCLLLTLTDGGQRAQALPKISPAIILQSVQPESSPIYWDATPQNGLLVTSPEGAELVPGGPDMVRLLVQLQDAPAADASQRSLLEARQQTFLMAAQEAGLRLDVLRSFTTLFNGLAVTAAAETWPRLKALPGVRAVYPDVTLQAALNESVPLVGAPVLWAQAVRGKGQRVAVIDTGIDYTHPDLGGCLGTGCKVMGGWDFFNNDADPQDDNGHGTHVAGIVAANGTLKGVAPEASLLAYKVLNKNGSGKASDMIAALERALVDGATVVNMSIGGPGSPDDPLCQAVNALSALGVVVVVAAGNEGSAFLTITSPGLASQAITVAASDKSDALAVFSSRGPVASPTDILKPDLTAPGVAILSTVPKEGTYGSPDGYRSLDGTSMASPHVAGAAALLRQLHPSWNPAMIKAALQNSTRDLGDPVLSQGSGRLDLTQAATLSVLVQPGSLSFGADDLQLTTWQKSMSFQVTHLGGQTASYSLSLSHPLPEGAMLSLTPVAFTLHPGQSQVVTANLVVDNTLLADSDKPPYAYFSSILVQSGGRTVKMPLAFIKQPMLSVRLDLGVDEYPWLVVVHNRVDRVWSYPFYSSVDLLLPAGIYDVMVYFLDGITYVVREGVELQSYTPLLISPQEASHTLTLDFYDQSGEKVDFTTLRLAFSGFWHKATGIGLLGFGQWCRKDAACDRVNFSDLSPAYTYEVRAPTWRNGIYSDIYAQKTDGLMADAVLGNDPAAFQPVIHRNQPNGSGTMSIYRWWGNGLYFATITGIGENISAPYTFTSYYQPIPADARWGYSMFRLHNAPAFDPVYTPVRAQSAGFRVDESGVSLYALGNQTHVQRTETVLELPTGFSPVHWAGVAVATETLTFRPAASGTALLAGPMQDEPWGISFTHRLTLNGEVVSQGAWPGKESLATSGTLVFQGEYGGFPVNCYPGTGSVKLEMDSRLADSTPPVIASLSARLASGMIFDVLPAMQPVRLDLVVTDAVGVAEVEVAVRSNALTGGWQPLTLTAAGTGWQALLPALPPYARLDLRIRAVDVNGNRLENIFQPAFISQGCRQTYFPVVFR